MKNEGEMRKGEEEGQGKEEDEDYDSVSGYMKTERKRPFPNSSLLDSLLPLSSPPPQIALEIKNQGPSPQTSMHFEKEVRRDDRTEERWKIGLGFTSHK